MANTAAPAMVPVQRSYLCWVAASVVYVLGTVAYVLVSFSTVDDVVSGTDVPRVAGTFFTVALIVGAVVVLVLAALTVWFATRMRAGQAWARITLTVFGAVFALPNITGMLGGGGLNFNGENIDSTAGEVVNVVTAVITLALLVVAMVLQWLPATGPHFAPRPDPRFGPYAGPPR